MRWENLIKRIKTVLEHLKYNNMPLQGKVIINYILLLVFPIAIYFFMFNTYISDLRNEKLSLINQLNLQAVDSIDTYIRDLEQLSKQPLYTSGYVDEITIYSVLDSASSDDKTSNQYSTDLQEKADNNTLNDINSKLTYEENEFLLTLLKKLVQSKEYLYSAFIFNSKGTMLSYVMPNGQLFESYDSKNEEWFSDSIKLSGKPVVSGSIKFDNSYLIKTDKLYAFSVSRAIVEPYSVKTIGVISLFADISIFRDIFRKIESVAGEKFYIINEKDEIIYDIYEDNIAKPLSSLNPEIITAVHENLNNRNVNVEIDGKDYMVMCANIDTPQWKFIRIMSEDVLFSDVNKVCGRLIILIASFTLLSLIFSIAMSFGITQPLKKLISVMKVVEKGDLSVHFKVKYNDEIGQLGRSFNNMLIEINRLIHDVYITNIRKKEAELNALQMQINPHFIYNTLESIRMMAILNDDKDTSEMITILGKQLRYSINTSDQIVKVKDEIEHLKNYIALQNHRFDDRFELDLYLSEELYDISIIKLVFQPIVENTIYHAFEHLHGKGIITVNGAFGENGISFEIKDNGGGMSEEQLEKLIQHANDFTSAKGDSHGVGLRNVNERIKLYYGEAYGLEIFSQLEKGTIIRLELPSKESMNTIKI